MRRGRHTLGALLDNLPKPAGADQRPEDEERKGDRPSKVREQPRNDALVAEVEQELMVAIRRTVGQALYSGAAGLGAPQVREPEADDARVAQKQPLMDRPAATAEGVPLEQEVTARVQQ